MTRVPEITAGRPQDPRQKHVASKLAREPPNRFIKFGPLFYIYAHYSEKLVGMLIRARKYKLLDFEGEMLYQRQDDDKIIRLLKPIEEIRKISFSGDPVNCMAVAEGAK
ncbi:unnamed protein product [Gongylonema pulchrum]|uniref:Costars domain-containing protein n=1 Tax=Gongylonema pulchrum TaxID=637853 RepID=A0A183E207_9BILA|nr:unnamed protein product [Gongylonema pulchrum]